MNEHDQSRLCECGPVYGVPLLETLPLGGSGMLQAMPGAAELAEVRRVHERVVAAYEVLTDAYRDKCDEVSRLKGLLADV